MVLKEHVVPEFAQRHYRAAISHYKLQAWEF